MVVLYKKIFAKKNIQLTIGKLEEQTRHTCDSIQVSLGSCVFNMWSIEMLKRCSGEWSRVSPQKDAEE